MNIVGLLKKALKKAQVEMRAYGEYWTAQWINIGLQKSAESYKDGIRAKDKKTVFKGIFLYPL